MNIIITGRPVSKKRNYLRSANGGLFLSKTYKTWQQQALWQLKGYKEKPTGNLIVYYKFFMKGKLDTDVDNLIVSINDLLQDAGIIENDKFITEGWFKKIAGNTSWRTEVTIEQI